MNRFILAVEKSLEDKNWYAALSLALALPDICANVCSPDEGSKSRYVKWYDQYLLSKYTLPLGADKTEHIFLNGVDCYSLRCSFLHEGSDDITEQRAQEVLESFNFVVPPEGWTVHMNQSGKALQLQVDVFCRDICEAVNEWLSVEKIQSEKFNSFLTICDVNGAPIA